MRPVRLWRGAQRRGRRRDRRRLVCRHGRGRCRDGVVAGGRLQCGYAPVQPPLHAAVDQPHRHQSDQERHDDERRNLGFQHQVIPDLHLDRLPVEEAEGEQKNEQQNPEYCAHDLHFGIAPRWCLLAGLTAMAEVGKGGLVQPNTRAKIVSTWRKWYSRSNFSSSSAAESAAVTSGSAFNSSRRLSAPSDSHTFIALRWTIE